MKLILLITLVTSSSAAPLWITNQLSSLWDDLSIGVSYGVNEVWDYAPYSVRRTLNDAFYGVVDYTPDTVKRNLNHAYDEGSDLLRDLALDIQDDIGEAFTDRVGTIADIGEEVFEELHATVRNLKDIVTSGLVVDEELADWQRIRIVKLNKQIQEVAVNLTMEDEESRSRLEAKVQYLLKEMKVMLADDAVTESFFSRLDRIKFQTQRTRAVLLESLTELSQVFKSFFDTVAKKEKVFVADRNNGTDHEEYGNQGINGTDYEGYGRINGTDHEEHGNQTSNGWMAGWLW